MDAANRQVQKLEQSFAKLKNASRGVSSMSGTTLMSGLKPFGDMGVSSIKGGIHGAGIATLLSGASIMAYVGGFFDQAALH